eukprot:354406-Chlamydomonas_euryale.AAC.4
MCEPHSTCVVWNGAVSLSSPRGRAEGLLTCNRRAGTKTDRTLRPQLHHCTCDKLTNVRSPLMPAAPQLRMRQADHAPCSFLCRSPAAAYATMWPCRRARTCTCSTPSRVHALKHDSMRAASGSCTPACGCETCCASCASHVITPPAHARRRAFSSRSASARSSLLPPGRVKAAWRGVVRVE